MKGILVKHQGMMADQHQEGAIKLQDMITDPHQENAPSINTFNVKEESTSTEMTLSPSMRSPSKLSVKKRKSSSLMTIKAIKPTQ